MYFSQADINTVIRNAHSYISKYAIKIIDQYTCLGSSNLEGFFYQYLNILSAVEDRQFYDYNDIDYQKIVLLLYSMTDLSDDTIDFSYTFIYGNIITFTIGQGMIPFIGLSDVPQSYSGKGGKLVTVGATEDRLIFSDLKTTYSTTTGTNYTINWTTDLVPGDTRTYLQKHGSNPNITEENQNPSDGSWSQNASASYIWNAGRTILILVPQADSSIFTII